MKITLNIPDPEKARQFLDYFVPNLPFIDEVAVERQSWSTIKDDPFKVAPIQLREGVGKDQVFQEQKKGRLDFRGLQYIVGRPEENECDLEGLLHLI